MIKILFTAVSAHGHVLPMVPLMESALAQGHRVGLVVSGLFEPVVESDLPVGVELLRAGPMPLELATLAAERTQGDVMYPTVAGIGETFGGVMLDLSLPEAIPAARAWAPDVIIADSYNTVGPFLSAALQVPWWRLSMTVRPPTAWLDAIALSSHERYIAAELEPRDPAGTVELWPDELSDPEGEAWDDGPIIEMAFSAHRGRGVEMALPAIAPDRPRVVVSMGTIFSDATALESIAARLALMNVDAVITSGLALGETTKNATEDSSVEWVEFTPIARLLRGASAVISVGGAGTVLATLAAGIPLVLWPHGADQPGIAARVVEAGAGLNVSGLEDLASTLATVLSDGRFKTNARTVATVNASRPNASDVLTLIRETV